MTLLPRDREVARWLIDLTTGGSGASRAAEAARDLSGAVLEAGLGGIALEHARLGEVQFEAAVASAFSRQASLTAAWTMHSRAELETILGALWTARVPTMLLKGAALSLCRSATDSPPGLPLYDRPDLRPMTDVDLLVRPADAARAIEALESCGCRRGMALLNDDLFPEWYYELEFFGPSPQPLRIDLHARPLRPLPLARWMPEDALWAQSREARVGDTSVRVPGPEAMLIHLAAHAAFHGCRRLIWVYDLHRTLEQQSVSLNWDIVVSLARRWRLAAAVYSALQRCKELFESVTPDTALNALARGGDWRQRLVLRTAPDDARSGLRQVMVNLLCTPGLRFRAGYLATVLRADRRHLGELYRHRHPGWVTCAQLYRAARALRRCVTA